MVDNWENRELLRSRAHIVCAACRQKRDQFIVTGARHWDDIMRRQRLAYERGYTTTLDSSWEQGFIDQFGFFYTREDAMAIVKENMQPFNSIRNGGSKTKLFSEGIY